MPEQQLEFDFVFHLPPCRHDGAQYETHSVIPSGLVCAECGELLLQYIPESPEVLGYVSADWYYLYGEGLNEIHNEKNQLADPQLLIKT